MERVIFRPLACSLLALAALSAQSWESELYRSANGHFERRPVDFAGRSWQLDDFSYSGYALGARPLASVPCREFPINAAGDISAAVQSAINEAAAAGGGIVCIPAGEFTMSRSVFITSNNIAIEGAGSGSTVIRVPETYKPAHESNEGVFTFGIPAAGWNQGWVHQGPALTQVTAPVAKGAFHADAADPSRIQPGMWIVLQQYFWKDFVDRHSTTPNRWIDDGSNRVFSFTYVRRVLAKSGSRIFFDAPIPWPLDPANNPITIRATNSRMIENSGLRGITIDFANNRASATNRPLGVAAYFEGVFDGWAADVKVRNIARFGFSTIHSARVTFLDSSVDGAQDYGEDGYGYGFHIHSSQNILLKRCTVNDARRPFTSQRALTSTLVYSECASSNATQGDDTHHSMIHSVLWDRHRQRNGVNLTAYNRGNFSTGAYEAFGSGVVWNFDGDGVRGRVSTGGQIHLKPSPDGNAIVVGGVGQHAVFDNSIGNPFRAGERINSAPGLQIGSQPNAMRNVLYEGLGQPGLTPASLFDAQRFERTGSRSIDVANACSAPPAASISPSGVVSSASSEAAAPLAPGALVSVYGRGLASGTTMIGSRRAPVLFAGDTQVNIQIPWETEPGAPLLSVASSAAVPIPVTPAAPAIFRDASNNVVAQHPDGALVSASRPALPGGVIVVYLAGAGPIDGPVTTGAATPSDRLFRTTLPATAKIGGLDARIEFLGLTPGFVGLYQANIAVPAGLPTGTHPVEITVDGVVSNAPRLPAGPP